jgi:zinc D-Ala-D-Ala carboxypeptidase
VACSSSWGGIALGQGYLSQASSSRAATPPVNVLPSGNNRGLGAPVDVPPSDNSGALGAPDGALPSDRRGALGAADGVLPDGTTVFDDQLPGVANLKLALLAALRRAATDAAKDGVDVYVDSGWRSPEYQEALLQQAVLTYGSEAVAARWVATPKTSPHVSGDAVDLGPADATAWLSAHGAKYGLCQIYRNEPWHYELRPGAADNGCPPMYADPTHDPRMQQ